MTAPVITLGARAMQRRTGRVGIVTHIRVDDAGRAQSVELTCFDGSKVITSPCQLQLRPVALAPAGERAALQRRVRGQDSTQPTLFDQPQP